MSAHSFDQLKEGGCGSITPLNLINSLNQGFDRGNSLYQKLWDHLGKREKLDLRSTKTFFFTWKQGWLDEPWVSKTCNRERSCSIDGHGQTDFNLKIQKPFKTK